MERHVTVVGRGRRLVNTALFLSSELQRTRVETSPLAHVISIDF